MDRTFETAAELLGRLKIGREEFCQRLLTMLILGDEYPVWNTRNEPSALGLEFLRTLYGMSFGSGDWPGSGQYVDELELPPRHDVELGGAPDQAVIWPNRLWMIELKTEKGSHRQTQIPHYFELGAYHYPGCSVDLTYLTPTFEAPFTPKDSVHRYAQLTWPAVAQLIGETWKDEPGVGHLVQGLLDAIDRMEVETPSEHRARVIGESASLTAVGIGREAPNEEKIIELAQMTAADGTQRAVNYWASNLEELQALRLEVKNAICAFPEGSEIRHVQPWLWKPESTGAPLTAAGKGLGYELRLSRYTLPVCPE